MILKCTSATTTFRLYGGLDLLRSVPRASYTTSLASNDTDYKFENGRRVSLARFPSAFTGTFYDSFS